MKRILLGTTLAFSLLNAGCGAGGDMSSAQPAPASSAPTTTVTKADSPPPGEPPSPSMALFRQDYQPPSNVTRPSPGERPTTGGPPPECTCSPRPEGERPDGQRPDGERPDGERPDGERPDGQRPDGQRPDGQRPDGERPDGQRPDGERPDGQRPDGQRPDGERPDGAPRPEGSPRTYTVPLRPGWNAVGLQCSHILSMQTPPGAAGMAFFDGSTYPLRPLNCDNANNEDEGPRRGFWVFATSVCNLTYTGVEDGRGDFVKLRRGWNMVSFAMASRMHSRNLKALVLRGNRAVTVPVNAVVLPQFFQIGRDNGQLTIDAVAGADLEPGNCYWIFAAERCALTWGRPPVLEPSPAPSPTCTCSPRPQASPGTAPSPRPTVSPRPAASPRPPGTTPTPGPGQPTPGPTPDDGHGNNGVGNGVDPPPPGDPRPNDDPGTGPGNPGNQPN